MKINSNTLRCLTLLLSVNFSSLSQAQDGPPPASMPSTTNTVLVDSIIKVSHHELYFTKYCTEKVKAYAIINNWPDEKTNKVLRSIKFKYYSSTIYNSYADYSGEDLRKLLDVLKRLNKKCNEWSCMLLTNYMMQSNLDLFIESLVEEKYVTD